MIKSILKVSIRSMLKHKWYSAINVFGLTIGFTAFILIAVFIRHEISWDKYNEHYDRMYRVQRHFTNAVHVLSGNNISPHSQAITAQLLENNYPEIEKVTVIHENGGRFLSLNDDQQIYDTKGIAADSNFFSVFTYRFIEGKQGAALDEPFAIVLSKTTAEKLFPNQNALGEKITIDQKHDYKVTGIYEDLPENASVRPSYIISFSTLAHTEGIKRSDLRAGNCMNYVLLKPNSDYKHLNNQIRNTFSDFAGLEYEEIQLRPMKKVYLSYNGNMDYLIILGLFALIGLFILIMSVFNYINLTTANSTLRSKEVAVKKVCGSRTSTLISQFLAETLIISISALLLSVVLAKLVLPIFASIVDKPLTLNLIREWKFLILMVFISIGCGFLAGIYPAFILSSMPISKTIRSKAGKVGFDKFTLKKTLVTFQFAISIFLILISLTISLQIKHMYNRDLGFKKENIYYTELTSTQQGISYEQLRHKIMQYPAILDVSMSKHIPFVSYGGGMTNWEGSDPGHKINCRFNTVSYDFIKTLGIEIVAGRDFSRNLPGDIGKACLINETAAKSFGWDDPIGKKVNNNTLTVVGVVKNFIYKDIHNAIEPSVMVLASDEVVGKWGFAFKTDSDNPGMTKASIVQELKNTFPNDPFELRELSYTFAHEDTFKIYHSVNNSIIFFTAINIFLAVIGLLGLVSFTLTRRTKEIAVRKINGSNLSNIFYLLSKKYFILILIAILIAFPCAYAAYNAIPGAFKLPPQLWVYGLGAGIILSIVTATISYQTIKAALRNPIESLRYE